MLKASINAQKRQVLVVFIMFLRINYSKNKIICHFLLIWFRKLLERKRSFELEVEKKSRQIEYCKQKFPELNSTNDFQYSPSSCIETLGRLLSRQSDTFSQAMKGIFSTCQSIDMCTNKQSVSILMSYIDVFLKEQIVCFQRNQTVLPT